MAADERFSDPVADLPDAMPERWETAIEDLAQAIALGLDRAQDIADAINDVARAHPVVARAVAAAIVGALVGTLIAARTARKPKPEPPAATDISSAAVDQAIAIARAAAERLSRRAPSRGDFASGAARITETVREKVAPTTRRVDAGRVRYAAQLVPLTIALLKNPIVRDLIARAATHASRSAQQRGR